MNKQTAIQRRDTAMMIARSFARFKNLEMAEKVVIVGKYVRRAQKEAPISERQINGLIELGGLTLVEQLGLVPKVAVLLLLSALLSTPLKAYEGVMDGSVIGSKDGAVYIAPGEISDTVIKSAPGGVTADSNGTSVTTVETKPSNFIMASPKFPTSVVNVPLFGDLWAMVAEAEVLDGAYATFNDVGIPSTYMLATNFGFAIPANATITGVEVSIVRHSNQAYASNNITDTHVNVVTGNGIGGTDHATAAWWPLADGTAYYGSSNDLWGQPLTPADVNAATFGVAMAVKGQAENGSETAFVDSIKVSVGYTLP